MIKKVMAGIAILASAFSIAAFAEEAPKSTFCNFSEKMVIRSAPAGSKILAMSGDGLRIWKKSETVFYIENGSRCESGTAKVRIGTNDQNYTEITFHDGPWMFAMEIKTKTSVGNVKFDGWNQYPLEHRYELYFKS